MSLRTKRFIMTVKWRASTWLPQIQGNGHSEVAKIMYSPLLGRGFKSRKKVIYTTKLSIHIPNPSLPPSLSRHWGRVPSEILQTFP